MSILINFDSNFKSLNYKTPFDLRSALWLAVYKVENQCPHDDTIRYLKDTYQNFIDRTIQEIKTASEAKVNILQIDLKKHRIAPPEYNLRILAQALYRFYGIELKQVDQLSQPNVMVVSWNKDNPIFNTSSHQFQDFRKSGFFVDYKIKCREENFPVHKLVLAAKSSYFQSELTKGFKASDEHQIPFEDVEVASVAAWLDYLYTNDVKVKEETVFDLIRFAQYYDMGHLQQKCCDYLCKTVNLTNLVQFIDYAHCFNLDGLEGALVASVQSEISLENLEVCLELLHQHKIKDLKTVCLTQIENNFKIAYYYFHETQELLEVAEKFSYPEIKLICNKKFEIPPMNDSDLTFDFLMKWFSLSEKHELTNISSYCTKKVKIVLNQSNDLLNEIKQLLQLADRYNLTEIKEDCTTLLINNIEQEYDKIFNLAKAFNLDRLKQACLEFKNQQTQ